MELQELYFVSVPGAVLPAAQRVHFKVTDTHPCGMVPRNVIRRQLLEGRIGNICLGKILFQTIAEGFHLPCHA